MRTLDEIVDDLEDRATEGNYHEYVSMYRQIAEIVTTHAGEEIAAKVMNDIESLGGFLD